MKFTREKVRAEMLAILGKHAQPGAKISDSSHIIGDLGIDSLGLAEMIADIEDQFQINIPDEALRDYDTAGSVIRAIEKRLKDAGRLDG